MISRKAVAAFIAAAIVAGAAGQASAETLFKIVTVKDEIVVGLTDAELAALGGNDAGAVAKAISSKGTLTLWRYASKKAANGDLQMAPLDKVGVLANSSLRVEPYKSPLKVLPHE
jgi:hypothetical protein